MYDMNWFKIVRLCKR